MYTAEENRVIEEQLKLSTPSERHDLALRVVGLMEEFFTASPIYYILSERSRSLGDEITNLYLEHKWLGYYLCLHFRDITAKYGNRGAWMYQVDTAMGGKAHVLPNGKRVGGKKGGKGGKNSGIGKGKF